MANQLDNTPKDLHLEGGELIAVNRSLKNGDMPSVAQEQHTTIQPLLKYLLLDRLAAAFEVPTHASLKDLQMSYV